MCYKYSFVLCSFDRVLSLDENCASAHHYLGCIELLRLLAGDGNNVDLREACLRHLIQVCSSGSGIGSGSSSSSRSSCSDSCSNSLSTMLVVLMLI